MFRIFPPQPVVSSSFVKSVEKDLSTVISSHPLRDWTHK